VAAGLPDRRCVAAAKDCRRIVAYRFVREEWAMSLPTLSRPVLILVLVTMACHALLPFTDYLCFDDLWMVNWVHNKHFDYLREIYSQHGSTTGYWYFSAFSFVENIGTTFKVIACILCFLNGWLVYRIGKRSGFLLGQEALFLGIVTIAFPAYKFNGGFIYSGYEVPLTVFLGAILLALHADAWSGWKHWLARGCVLLLFSFSFLMPSLLMFYGGFFCLLVLMRQRSQRLGWYHVPWDYCLAHIDLLLLPFFYWLCKTTLETTSGYYAGYNKPSFSIAAILAGYRTLPAVLFDPVVVAFSFTPAMQLVLLVVSLLLVLGVLFWRRRLTARATVPSGHLGGTVGLLLFGLMLLVLGTAPYIAVKKFFSPWGVLSTYTPLIPIPLGIILLALVNAYRRLLPRLTAILPVGLSIALVLCATTWWDNYLALQALKVRNDSIMLNLHRNPASWDCMVFCYQNDFRIPRTTDDIHSWLWSYTECGVSGEPRSFAFNSLVNATIPKAEVKQSIDQSTIPYALAPVDPAGKQQLLLIQPGPGFQGIRSAALSYLYLKYFHPTGMPAYLESLTDVRFLPTPWQQPNQGQ
jgi:hypothetical protein